MFVTKQNEHLGLNH